MLTISPTSRIIRLDPLSQASYIEQVKEHLRQQIESGERQPGEQLHSETVGAIFDVSKRTAARALQILATTGHVVIVRSRGTYVARRG